MVKLKELKRIFLEVREKLVAESHKLMSELKTDFNSNYDGAIDTVHRMLEVFEGLKVLSQNSESFLGALEAEGRVAEAKAKLHVHLAEFAIPVSALKRHKEALKDADLSLLQSVLERESGRDSLDINLPEEMDPVIASLAKIYPEIFAALSSGNGSLPLIVNLESSGSDHGLDVEKAALVKALMEDDTDDDDDDEAEFQERENIRKAEPLKMPALDEVIAAQIGLDIAHNDSKEESSSPIQDSVDDSQASVPSVGSESVFEAHAGEEVEQDSGLEDKEETEEPHPSTSAEDSLSNLSSAHEPVTSDGKEVFEVPAEGITEDDVDFSSDDSDILTESTDNSIIDDMVEDIDGEDFSDVDEGFLGAMFSESDDDPSKDEAFVDNDGQLDTDATIEDASDDELDNSLSSDGEPDTEVPDTGSEISAPDFSGDTKAPN